MHDIGKNIVRLMLEAAGLYDPRPGQRRALWRGSSRRPGPWGRHRGRLHPHVNDHVEHGGPRQGTQGGGPARHRFRVMVGGGPVPALFATKIGADGYGANAMEAVRIASSFETATLRAQP